VPQSVSSRSSSKLGGIAIVAGTTVGAGMFSLPLVASGMWFGWSVLLLLCAWFCMCLSGLYILESLLNFKPGASFDTLVGETLGPRWKAVNNLALSFVLYILLYAYISGGGSVVSTTLEGTLGLQLPGWLAGPIFASGLAFVVWLSSAWVGRITAVLIGGMAITFLLSVSGLLIQVDTEQLSSLEAGYGVFALAAMPYFLVSFGFHGCVPSLVKLYGIEPRKIRSIIIIGSMLTLATYVLWLLASFGNIERSAFPAITAAGGNIGDLLAALDGATDTQRLSRLLSAFANMAVVSSFLGVALGLFDFLADRFSFDDTSLGRLKTAALTFIPPSIGGLFFPDGFLYAIGLAGLAGCIWGAFVPALTAKASREKFGNPNYRVWGGTPLVYVLMGYGLLVAVCWLLAAVELLPKF
jgi:tryptophan-specific transport protein